MNKKPIKKPSETNDPQKPDTSMEEPDLTPLQRLERFVATLSHEEISALRASNVLLPIGKADAEVWGYRCSSCNDIGAVFRGEGFVSASGHFVGEPDVGIPFAEQPFSEVKNLGKPECIKCGCDLHVVGGMMTSSYIVDIRNWRSSRDEAYDKIAKSRRLSNDDSSHPARITIETEHGPVTFVDNPFQGRPFGDQEKREKAIELTEKFGMHEARFGKNR